MYKTLVFLLSVVAAMAAPTSSILKMNREQVQAHYDQVFNFTCLEPQIRAVPLSSRAEMAAGVLYTPPVTVLRLCDGGSGCCKAAGQTCGPDETRPVKRVFSVTRLKEGGGKETFYQTITFTEHTSCKCSP